MVNSLLNRINERSALIGIIGLGYVGLPLVLRFCEEGFKVCGFDIDREKADKLNRGESYIKHISSEKVRQFVDRRLFEATVDMQRLKEADAIIICVPTPLTDKREPDMQYVEATAREVARHLRPGQLISLESTTYPGTTEELLLPLLTEKGLKVGRDFFLVFSPEREDPGRKDFTTKTTPKIVGGVTQKCLEVGAALYSKIVDKVVKVSSPRTAEMTKLLENIYRSVNIALVNELKMLCDRMGIDMWEVIEAAKTKPFGFEAFYPGPGLGRHCIPVDPFYLTWKARLNGGEPRFIELAAQINSQMPLFTITRVADALNERQRSLKGSKILGLGVAYKRDTSDTRESPALEVLYGLHQKGAAVYYSDPHVPTIRLSGEKTKSLPLNPDMLQSMDCVVLLTDHSAFDYQMIAAHSHVIVDCRNAFKGFSRSNIVSL